MEEEEKEKEEKVVVFLKEKALCQPIVIHII